jgi:methionyl-tRNA formyltransferase
MNRYIFVGAVEFSARCLDALLDAGANVVEVLSPLEKGINADYRDLSVLAERRGVASRKFKKIADEAEHVASLKPDLVFVMGLSQILPPALLRAPRIGCLGSHPALLPENRGRHPIVWALANGLTQSGLSLLWLDEGVDTGDLWRQREFPIAPDDDAGSVYEKVCCLGTEMLREGLTELETGRVVRRPQDHSRANYWRRRGPADGLIDWRMSSKRICDLVRALRPPYVGAHCLLQGGEVKVWRVQAEPAQELDRFEPGRVMLGGPAPIVKTGDGAVRIVEWQSAEAPKEGEYLA